MDIKKILPDIEGGFIVLDGAPDIKFTPRVKIYCLFPEKNDRKYFSC